MDCKAYIYALSNLLVLSITLTLYTFCQVLIKIEKHVRNELRLQRAREAAAVAATAVMT